MPIYTYRIINDDGSEGDIVELVHGMNDSPLTIHPKTGQKLQRIFTAPHIAGWANERQAKHITSDENLERHGFTKYARSGKGHYEKRTSGRGPSSLHVDE
ncbi:MAG TPA: FmdB family transcriptional regulator [Candidatus Hydrogenedentes bacterium]|nr:FmdB family transcriptional regulator [Candidatus Hydrogenedentota bacterium]